MSMENKINHNLQFYCNETYNPKMYCFKCSYKNINRFSFLILKNH